MAGVYISYPFCAQKCSFCNFASDVASDATRERYHAALLDELRAHRWSSWRPETLYFGGGTPSLMPPDLLDEILELIPREQLGEVTLECAPGTLNPQSLAGISRVSLGVQSFVTAELHQTGRRHTAEIVAHDVALLRNAGIENFNLDLIAGLPEQTEASWEQSLDWIERLAPPHVSIYLFESDEDSRLGQELLLGGKRYGAARMPTDEAMAAFYERAVSRLASLGIHRYEISNFAQPGYESRHNLKYWQLEPYIGFGLDAHSFDNGRRWSNPDTLPAYLNRTPAEATATDPAEEHFFVGLRLTKGIEPTPTEWQRFAQPIAKWTRQGLLEHTGPSLRLAPAGVLLSNEIFQDFLVG